MNERLGEALELMAVGMTVVFVVLCLVWLMIALVGRFVPPEPEPEAAMPLPAKPEAPHLVLVVSAAIAAYLGLRGDARARIVSIQPRDQARWADEGRSRHHVSHNLRTRPKDNPKR